jgi:tetratricopeptide (TPR) repeat protein
VSAAKSSSSEGGSHAQIASPKVTEDQELLGRRLLALTGLWLLLSGLLLAMSLVVVALVALALYVLVASTAGSVWLLRRLRIEERLPALLVAATRPVGSLAGQLRGLGVRRRTRRLGNRARERAAGAPGRMRAVLTRTIQGYAIAAFRLRMLTARLVQAGVRRRALRLNALGSELRRRGDHERAAEQHRLALAIVRDLGDEQAEAMTLNNLALALANSGAEGEAVQHLEQARGVLSDLGDEKHEAQVIANLGIVYRRWGHDEEAVNYLHQALDKLPPESSAYRQVEEELSRAS